MKTAVIDNRRQFIEKSRTKILANSMDAIERVYKAFTNAVKNTFDPSNLRWTLRTAPSGFIACTERILPKKFQIVYYVVLNKANRMNSNGWTLTKYLSEFRCINPSCSATWSQKSTVLAVTHIPCPRCFTLTTASNIVSFCVFPSFFCGFGTFWIYP